MQSDLRALLEGSNLNPKPRRELFALLPALDCWESEAEILPALRACTAAALTEGTRAKKEPPSHLFFDACEEFEALAERYFRQLAREALDYAGVEIDERKRRRNVLSYDDLLTRVHAALEEPRFVASLRKAYEAVLIDEFQDTDTLQYDIFRRLFADGAHWLFLIGDPKQAIYGFRGADIFTYLKASSDADRRLTLETNRRSDQALLDAFNAFFARRDDAFIFDKIQYCPVHSHLPEIPDDQTPPLEFRWLLAESGERFSSSNALPLLAAAAAADLERLHVAGRPWGDMAVLVRSAWQGEAVERALRQRGIPCVRRTEQSVFQTPQAATLLFRLQKISKP